MKKAHHLTPTGILVFFFTMACMLGTAVLDIGSCAAANPDPKGFYRTMVGDFEVIALCDGIGKRQVEQRVGMLFGDKDKIKGLLMGAYPAGEFDASISAFLINTGTKIVLVDTGTGVAGNPPGTVIDNLRAAGYPPEKINEVYLTHMHPDHVGGLAAGAERLFPNAMVYASKSEADYWLGDVNLDKLPPPAKANFLTARAAIAPYRNAGKFQTFDGNAQLTQGITTKATYGHTAGHTSYVLESKGKKLVLLGDLVQVEAVQFALPSVSMAFDENKEQAAVTRQQTLAEAAKNGWLTGYAHVFFPGFGYVTANGDKGYVFAPLGSPAAQ